MTNGHLHRVIAPSSPANRLIASVVRFQAFSGLADRLVSDAIEVGTQ